jgi:sugar lactone lactonase YvrE
MSRRRFGMLAPMGLVALLAATSCSNSSAPLETSGSAVPSGAFTSAITKFAFSTVPESSQHHARPALHPLVRGSGWLSPAVRSCQNKLYVSSYRLNYVSIYCEKGQNQAPIGQITAGINTPEGANTDSQGNLYVTNTDANTVTEYKPGTLTPSFTYSSGLTYPAGVAVDKKGNVYVSSLSPATIQVFAQGINSPIRTISDAPYPIDVALDPSGDLFVTSFTANFSNGIILKYLPGGTQGTDLGIVTKNPGGITLDGAGHIVTADQTLPGVLVFPRGSNKPSSAFAGNVMDPDPLRFASGEKLVFVGDSTGNAVYVYDYPSGSLVDTITDGIDGPNGLALDPSPAL